MFKVLLRISLERKLKSYEVMLFRQNFEKCDFMCAIIFEKCDFMCAIIFEKCKFNMHEQISMKEYIDPFTGSKNK